MEYFDAHFGEIADFCTDQRYNGYGNIPSCYDSVSISITNYHETSSIYRWESRFRDEVKAKVDDIVVNLELGGTRADLERLLDEI